MKYFYSNAFVFPVLKTRQYGTRTLVVSWGTEKSTHSETDILDLWSGFCLHLLIKNKKQTKLWKATRDTKSISKSSIFHLTYNSLSSALFIVLLLVLLFILVVIPSLSPLLVYLQPLSYTQLPVFTKNAQIFLPKLTLYSNPYLQMPQVFFTSIY